tara:strand:+ start:42 stop:1373 length:1332 start_codon:yes stop_codon:yes gene_type:complete
MAKKFFLFRRTDPEGKAKRFSENGVDISILGIPADEIAFMTAGRGEINITFNGAGMYEENELFVGDSIEKTNITVSCKKGEELELIEKIMLFVSNPGGKTVMKFDSVEKKATFDNALAYSVTDINVKIKSQPTEMVSQKISTGDPANRFRNIVGGINFGSTTNKPFLDYNHELLTGADDSTLTLWRNSGTGSSTYNIANHTGTVTVQDEATAADTGLSKKCAQFAVGAFLNIPDATIEGDYTIYFAIGDPSTGSGSFGSLFGDDLGETLGFSKDGHSSFFTMRHDGLEGKPFEQNTDSSEGGSVRYAFPDKSSGTQIGARQFCYVFVIRRDKDFNVSLHNHEGEIIAFIPAFTENSTSKIQSINKGKDKYEKKSISINSKVTAASPGRTDGNLLLQRLGTAGTNITSSFSGTLARFGVIKRDIGAGNASELAKDLYELYKPIS